MLKFSSEAMLNNSKELFTQSLARQLVEVYIKFDEHI